MGTCVVCGNDHAKSFDVLFEGGIMTFDSFECAIHRLAPSCSHCDCRIIGHAVEAEGAMYCCAHCARDHGAAGAVDHPAA
jgi:Zn finger protein HypA/HybF involved in hydrogenase expression